MYFQAALRVHFSLSSYKFQVIPESMGVGFSLIIFNYTRVDAGTEREEDEFRNQLKGTRSLRDLKAILGPCLFNVNEMRRHFSVYF